MEKQEVKIVKFAPLTLGKTVQNETDGSEDRPTLRWSMRAGYPRVTVFTSKNLMTEGDKMDYNKMIIAPFDIISLNLFLQLSKEVLDNKEKSSYREVNCLNNKFENGERTNEKYVQATVRIGIYKDGIAYIVVMASDKPKIKFDILPPEWFEFKDENGDIITHPSKLSREYAKVYLNTLEKLLDSEMDSFKKIDIIETPVRNKYVGKSKYPKKEVKEETKVKEDKPVDKATEKDVNDILDDIL